MKNIRFLVFIFIAIILAVFVAKTAFAQNATVESDFAKDVASGEEELKNDPEAAQAQKEVDAAEDVEAQIDSAETTAQTVIQPEEAVEPTTELLPPDMEVTITPEPEPEVPPQEPSQKTPSPESTETPIETPIP